MKTYRIIYWFGSIKSERIIKADSKQKAIEKFIKTVGDKVILEIIEI